MAVNSYTTEALLASARRRAFVPNDTQSWPDSDLLALMNEELSDWLTPFVVDAREGHFLKNFDQPFVSGQADYVIPFDASGDIVYSVHVLDATGSPCAPGLSHRDPEAFRQLGLSTGLPQVYTFVGNSISFWPTPTDTTYTLRLVYPRRPSQMVASSECAAVTLVTTLSPTSYSATFVTKPSAFTSTGVYDVVSAVPAFDVIASAAVATASTSTTVTLTGTAPTATQAAQGLYLCLTRQAPLMTQVPAELYSYFTQHIAVKMLEAKGDAEAQGRAQNALKEAEARARKFLGQRDEGGHRKVSPGTRRRGYGYFRGMR